MVVQRCPYEIVVEGRAIPRHPDDRDAHEVARLHPLLSRQRMVPRHHELQPFGEQRLDVEPGRLAADPERQQRVDFQCVDPPGVECLELFAHAHRHQLDRDMRMRARN